MFYIQCLIFLCLVYSEEGANVESLNENIFNITIEDNISSQSSNTLPMVNEEI